MFALQFDEILKVCRRFLIRAPLNVSAQYCNELSMTIELNTTIAQAEVLFLSFAQLAADIDRRQAEEQSTPSTVRRRGVDASGLNPGDTMPRLSDNLRELLNNGPP